MLAGKKAIYAGDPTLQGETRKFGTFVPNVKQYATCTANATNLLEHKYHVPASQIATPFYYNLDISTFQQSAQQAIVQFKAAGVTTVVIASDPFSAGLLTKAAAAQDYHPEWFMIGTAATDQDESIQTYDDPGEVTGHLFGMSELSPPTETTGPTSLAGKLYQKLTGHTIPKETDGTYSQLLAIFDMLQAAGPDLTPQNMARGIHALPTMGAPLFQYGAWSWNTSPAGHGRWGRPHRPGGRPLRLLERRRHLGDQRDEGHVRRDLQRPALHARAVAEDPPEAVHDTGIGPRRRRD